MTKFMWNGIYVDGILYRCRYSKGNLINYPESTITIYAKEYKPLPKIDGLNIKNDSDMMTDYSEKDRVYVTKENKHYNQVLNACILARAHYDKLFAKKGY